MKKPDFEMNWEKTLNFSIEMVQGIYALHSWKTPIFHRDVKSENILIDENWHIKVCDMGLARFNTEKNHSTLAKPCGTYAYLAPELFFGKKFTEKADVYSMGILLLEMVVRTITRKYSGTNIYYYFELIYKAPYEEFPQIKLDFQIAILAAEKGLRPTIPR